MDFAVYGGSTDPLLFAYEELDAIESACEFRTSDGQTPVLAGKHSTYRVPVEVSQASTADEIAQLVRVFAGTQAQDESDSEDDS